MARSKEGLSVKLLHLGLTAVFWLTLLGVVIGVPAGIATTVASDRPMSIHATIPAQELDDIAGTTGVVGGVSMGIPIDHLTTMQIVVFHGLFAVGGVVLLFALWQLRQLVGSIRTGDPFSSGNVRRLRIIGWLLLAGYPAIALGVRIVSEWILSTGAPTASGARPDVDPFSFGAIFGGLCLLTLAEVFAHGIELREDVEATI